MPYEEPTRIGPEDLNFTPKKGMMLITNRYLPDTILCISDSVTWRVGVWLSQYSSSFPGSQALGEPPSKFALLAVSFFWLVSVIFLYYR